MPPVNIPLAGGDTGKRINFSYYPMLPSSPLAWQPVTEEPSEGESTEEGPKK